MTRLYHYACHHSVDAIIADRGTLRPPAGGTQRKIEARARQLGLGNLKVHSFPVIWFSDVDVHGYDDALLMGLGNIEGLNDCLRVEYRFIVPNVGIERWADWADAHLTAEQQEYRALLDAADGCDPARWWVSDKPVVGRLDTAYRATGLSSSAS